MFVHGKDSYFVKLHITNEFELEQGLHNPHMPARSSRRIGRCSKQTDLSWSLSNTVHHIHRLAVVERLKLRLWSASTACCCLLLLLLLAADTAHGQVMSVEVPIPDALREFICETAKGGTYFSRSVVLKDRACRARNRE